MGQYRLGCIRYSNQTSLTGGVWGFPPDATGTHKSKSAKKAFPTPAKRPKEDTLTAAELKKTKAELERTKSKLKYV